MYKSTDQDISGSSAIKIDSASIAFASINGTISQGFKTVRYNL